MTDKDKWVKINIIRTFRMNKISSEQPGYEHHLNGRMLLGNYQEGIYPEIRSCIEEHSCIMDKNKQIFCIESRIEKEIK